MLDRTETTDRDHLAALAHSRRAAQQAVVLITSALDGDQLARLKLLLTDAGAHMADALEGLKLRPAT
ncbi:MULTISPECIES: hypothetical protein [unclassified Methylobacterium]|uniref:hypothetical protein n=1 Tax=unclassified Methylobacterium TaxID=2615210 RepID=UPI00226AECC5|nr:MULTISPECIES: hypothetical protein [unclassified Methylobacterium]